jgi:hypothetical protein
MGCNCGKTGTANVSAPSAGGTAGKYALTLPDGKRTFYDTETAARVANQKSGGKGLVRRIS